MMVNSELRLQVPHGRGHPGRRQNNPHMRGKRLECIDRNVRQFPPRIKQRTIHVGADRFKLHGRKTTRRANEPQTIIRSAATSLD